MTNDLCRMKFSYNLIIKRQTSILKWTELNSHFTKEDIRIAHKHIKMCSKTREM